MYKSFVNRILLLLGLLMIVGTASAQKRLRYPETYFGFHGGVEGATTYFNPAVPNMSPFLDGVLLGGNGGLVFRYSGQKCCAIQIELNYMQRGWREHYDTDDDYIRRLHYVELPLLMHIYFGSPTCRGFFNFGPQVGYMVKQTTTGNPPLGGYQYGEVDNKFDWGLAAGLGFYVRTPHAGLYQVEARFNYSFGTTFSSAAVDYFEMSNSMVASVNIAWLWEFKKKEKE